MPPRQLIPGFPPPRITLEDEPVSFQQQLDPIQFQQQRGQQQLFNEEQQLASQTVRTSSFEDASQPSFDFVQTRRPEFSSNAEETPSGTRSRKRIPVRTSANTDDKPSGSRGRVRIVFRDDASEDEVATEQTPTGTRTRTRSRYKVWGGLLWIGFAQVFCICCTFFVVDVYYSI